MKLGVLALQGDFAAHRRALLTAAETAGTERPNSGLDSEEIVEVRRPQQLQDLDCLVLPGGESSALLRLMKPLGMGAALADFAANGGWIFGTCAGTILLARTVTNPEQESLGLLDIVVERNGFGRQNESFIDSGTVRFVHESTDPSMVPLSDGEPSDMGILGEVAEPNEAGILGEVAEPNDAATLDEVAEPDGALVEMVFIRAPRIRQVGPGVDVLGTWRGEPVLVRQGRIFGATFHPELTPGAPLHLGFLREIARSLENPGGEPADPAIGSEKAASIRSDA